MAGPTTLARGSQICAACFLCASCVGIGKKKKKKVKGWATSKPNSSDIMVTHAWGSLHLLAPETVRSRRPLVSMWLLSFQRKVSGRSTVLDGLTTEGFSPQVSVGCQRSRVEWFLPSRSHSHNLETATVSYCCPCPFSVMSLAHYYFFFKWNHSPFLFPSLP